MLKLTSLNAASWERRMLAPALFACELLSCCDWTVPRLARTTYRWNVLWVTTSSLDFQFKLMRSEIKFFILNTIGEWIPLENCGGKMSGSDENNCPPVVRLHGPQRVQQRFLVLGSRFFAVQNTPLHDQNVLIVKSERDLGLAACDLLIPLLTFLLITTACQTVVSVPILLVLAVATRYTRYICLN